MAALLCAATVQATPVTTEPVPPTSLAVQIEQPLATRAPHDLSDVSDLYASRTAVTGLNPLDAAPLRQPGGATNKEGPKPGVLPVVLPQTKPKAAHRDAAEDGINGLLQDIKNKVKALKDPKDTESSQISDSSIERPLPHAARANSDYTAERHKPAQERRHDAIRAEVLLSNLISEIAPWAIGAGLIFLGILGLQAYFRKHNSIKYRHPDQAPPLRSPASSLHSPRRR